MSVLKLMVDMFYLLWALGLNQKYVSFYLTLPPHQMPPPHPNNFITILSCHIYFSSDSKTETHAGGCNFFFMFFFQFDETPAFQNGFSKRSKHTCDKYLAFLVFACPDYRFVQSDLVGSGFLKPIKTVREFCSNLQHENLDPCHI